MQCCNRNAHSQLNVLVDLELSDPDPYLGQQLAAVSVERDRPRMIVRQQRGGNLSEGVRDCRIGLSQHCVSLDRHEQ
jgi:hypothetical protein